MVHAQNEQDKQDKSVHAGEGQMRLILDKDWSKDDKELKTFQGYRRGDSRVGGIEPEILEHGAQWFAYRLTQPQYQDPGRPSAKGMHDLLKEAFDQIVDPRDQAKKVTESQLLFKQDFDKRFVVRLQEVVKNPKPIARHNAVMILGRLAATGDEDAVAVLLTVLKDDKETDGIKLFACRGIKDFFVLGQGDNPNPFRSKERETECIAALLAFLNRKPALPDDAPTKQSAAIPYIRRDAIAALGETRYPGAAKTDNTTKVTTIERPTALALVRFMRKDRIAPVPTLEEQVNAAAGVCRLRSHGAYGLDQYHVDYAAQQLGEFIVDFIDTFNAGVEKTAWKHYAARLLAALSDLRNDTTGREEGKYVAEVVTQAEGLLRTIVDSKGKPNPQPLAIWLEANKAPKQVVYEGVPDSAIQPPQKAAQ
jgi:hypothetical protein